MFSVPFLLAHIFSMPIFDRLLAKLPMLPIVFLILLLAIVFLCSSHGTVGLNIFFSPQLCDPEKYSFGQHVIGSASPWWLLDPNYCIQDAGVQIEI